MVDADSTWAANVERSRRLCRGELPCDECGGTGVRNDKCCIECDGGGRWHIPAREASAGVDRLHEGLCELADLIGDFAARGGLEHLPPRSRQLVQDLNDGGGEVLVELVARLRLLERDLCDVDEEHWPGAEDQARIEKLHAEWEAREALESDRRRADKRLWDERLAAARAAPRPTTPANTAAVVELALDSIAHSHVAAEASGDVDKLRRNGAIWFVHGQWVSHLEGALRGLREMIVAPSPPPPQPTTPDACCRTGKEPS